MPLIPGSFFLSFSTGFVYSAYRPCSYISRSFLRAWTDGWFGKKVKPNERARTF
jgi:hypothetical protein